MANTFNFLILKFKDVSLLLPFHVPEKRSSEIVIKVVTLHHFRLSSAPYRLHIETHEKGVYFRAVKREME